MFIKAFSSFGVHFCCIPCLQQHQEYTMSLFMCIYIQPISQSLVTHTLSYTLQSYFYSIKVPKKKNSSLANLLFLFFCSLFYLHNGSSLKMFKKWNVEIMNPKGYLFFYCNNLNNGRLDSWQCNQELHSLCIKYFAENNLGYKIYLNVTILMFFFFCSSQ